jgi:hypothetical protein
VIVGGALFGAFEGGWVECHGLWLPAWVVVVVVGCGFWRGCGCFCRGGFVIVGVALCLARSKVVESSAMGCGYRCGLLLLAWVVVFGVGVVVVAVVGCFCHG